ncbi:TIGR04283 family arsenosugar biosynthesis glycosyltransferase [Robiginitalea biformata]|uniref:Glycosyl transferase n=1 Tax=Robiginitalea biformata (strain ATCC BAA-864 / DSM 15991 / KCTC 12146 / HTCC2501) TaxID=313596 RepID=A4CNR5_ROBBH|nr:TIGR04283 family arsenosugar biosynthesis glycosyltransferase [Robiginitalea biformata]EAR14532.1 glycosyl transferase [Robiginitalea biformata HTCC2501]
MISVVIPIHNERNNLSRLIPHLQRIRGDHPVELLPVLSGATRDGSAEVLRELGLEPVRCEATSRASQMNAGARRARGTTLVFLHADVWPPDEFFRDISRTLSEDYQAGFFSYRFDNPTLLLRINGYFTRKDGLFTGGGDQCLFIEKQTFEALGGFDPDQVLMEDFEFFRRMKRARTPYRIVHNDMVVSARKYKRNSYLRVNLSNLFLLILFYCGCKPDTLKRLYGKLFRPNP